MTPDQGVDPFVDDVEAGGGYRYTTDAPLSSRLANRRITDAVLAATDWRGRRVIDIGCGDGTYSSELLELSGAESVHAVDPAEAAVDSARERHVADSLTFAPGSAYDLPHTAGEFDVAHLRGVLHHVERPRDALAEALRVAPVVVAVEPNGFNPGLKLLERVSRYHREHGERSYPPRRLDAWVRELGARVSSRQFVGFVPMFSPDSYARAAKTLEPVLEGVAGVRAVACAQYVFAVER